MVKKQKKNYNNLKQENYYSLAVVGVVAIIALVVMFMNKGVATETTDDLIVDESGNVIGEKSKILKWFCCEMDLACCHGEFPSQPIVGQAGYLGISDDCSSDSDKVNMLKRNDYLTEESNGNQIVTAKGVTITQIKEDSIVLTNDMGGRDELPLKERTISCSCPSGCSAQWCKIMHDANRAICRGSCSIGDHCSSCVWG